MPNPYQILIVEDEYLVRTGILKTIDWKALGFLPPSAADNGMTALTEIKKTCPQVIVTDIKMPLMNGLELIREIRKTDSSLRIVMLTGYDDFEYAREGMKYGVSDYVLKIDLPKGALERTLRRIHCELCERDRSECLQQEYAQLKDKLAFRGMLATLLHGGVARLSDLAGQCPSIRPVRAFCVSYLLIETQAYDLSAMACYTDAVSELRQMLETHFEGVPFELFCYQNQEIIIVFYSSEKQPEALSTSLTAKWKMFSWEGLSRYLELRLRVAVGVSPCMEDLNALPFAYSLAHKTVMSMLGSAPGLVVGFWRENETQTRRLMITFREKDALVNAVFWGDKAAVHSIVGQLFTDMKDSHGHNTALFRRLLEEVGVLINWKLNEEGLSLDGMRQDAAQERADGCEFLQYVMQSLETMADVCFELRCKSLEEKIRSVKYYIDSNYSKKITLDEISAMLHISPSYFSLLFKEYHQVGFKQYLIDVRMKRAHELISRGGMRVNEVCHQVGFRDVRHFSRLYSRYYKENPSCFGQPVR